MNRAAKAATIATSTRLNAFMYSPSLQGLGLQRVIAACDATVTDVVADFSRYCGETTKQPLQVSDFCGHATCTPSRGCSAAVRLHPFRASRPPAGQGPVLRSAPRLTAAPTGPTTLTVSS